MRITDEAKIKEYYDALVNRDSQYVGTFYVGVKTTGIFCIATCRARKPKFENVDFYSTMKGALDQGFRPCKICKPTGNANETPDDVQRAIDMIYGRPKEKVKDQDLRNEGISPENIRRWFNKHYGMTYQAYQRMYRINNAYQELQKGKSKADTAYDSGFESLSGFSYTYKKLTGKSPSDATYGQVILINRLTTPLGPMFVCATDQGICLLEFVDRRMLETEFHDLQKRLQAPILIGENEHIVQLKRELKEYFNGERQQFEVALHTPGTDFQNSVWQLLTTIPYGETRSYLKQAESLGNAKAVRAVATANGCNRIAIVIPCHRVIGSDGSLTGYAGGLERKRWLLEHEGATAQMALRL